ncbi:hypothetical protein JRO89_XS01G0387300 [Xanthoceras sorbifolium]|uniref:Uncharacterized protein n=1 Tax=Xanthoceras sorbifolium TaxID=99658 RepID=A0ABQ8IP41_9ROSI|nr:hypothetical protein JRO89_XS01G0387300 [Xanthoceras sorbifolium]
MQNIGTDDERAASPDYHHHSDTQVVGSVKAANGTDLQKDPKLGVAVLARGLEEERYAASGSSSLVRSVSARIRYVSRELKLLTSYPKKPPPRIDETNITNVAAHALEGLELASETDNGHRWFVVEERFNKISIDGVLPRDRFCECIGMRDSKEFALELFDALSRRNGIQGNSISKVQLREFWDQISNQSFDTKLQTIIYMVDKDGDGRISEEEVKEIISLSASANKLSNINYQAEEYAALIMEELDPDHSGYITTDSLEKLLLQAPSQLAEGGGRRKLSKMLSQKMRPTKIHNPIRRSYHSTKYFLVDNWQRVWVMALWIWLMVGLFAYKYVQYRHRAAYEVMGHCVCMAKGAAETLKFNMALILLPICRNTITWLRNQTKIGVALPFDDNLNFHKAIAIGISIGTGIHVISHLACNFPRLLKASEDKYELMEPSFGKQPKSYWHFVKSVEVITGIVMLVLMAIAFTLATSLFRRNRLNLPNLFRKFSGFNAFWYSHHLFVIVYTLLFVHGYYLRLTHIWYEKTTWMYLAIPICLYAYERLIRALRSSINPVIIQKVAVYPGNVLLLHMSKPQNFKYKGGQYMFVNCPAVSPFEWHPFYMTSAPGDDHLSVHIRTLGDWTQQLKTIFSQVCQPSRNASSLLSANSLQGNINMPKVLIDGPYGAPTQDYKNYEVVLLVGMGIGVASMISIVKDIVQNSGAVLEDTELALENGTNSATTTVNPLNSGSRRIKTRQAYLYWVTREQGSFEWFKGVMNEVAELDYNNAIELHSYLTSVYEEGDARSTLIAMLQSLNLAKNGVDILSGTRVKSHFGKPNWRNVYKRIALKHTNTRVGAFYCGPPGLRQELRQLGLDFSHKTTTKFDFHPDQF